MSLYAIPGFLFPPIDSGVGSCKADVSGSSNSSEINAEARPLHEAVKESKEEAFFESDADGVTKGEERLSSSVADTIKRGSREVWIAVRQAKIDPVRLVQSLTGVRGKSSVRNSAEANASHQPRRNHGGGSPPLGSPAYPTMDACTQRHSETQQNQLATYSNNSNECTPHEEAIQFELSINFNGRSYQATRTLPRIIQLRNDLIRELNYHRKILMRRRRKVQLRSSLQNADSIPNPGRKPAHEDDDSLSLSSDEDSLADSDDMHDLTIPELPCISDKGAPATVATGFVGRGFTMLHALLRSYCPAMEGWLLTVTSIISPNDSPTLTKFLWEPLSSGETTTPTVRSSHSFSCLDAIQENEYDDGGASEDNDDNAPAH
jgi:hypothetical protein